jgi:hypothetical protein
MFSNTHAADKFKNRSYENSCLPDSLAYGPHVKASRFDAGAICTQARFLSLFSLFYIVVADGYWLAKSF